MFGFPGGGFGRKYYDGQARPGFSQAQHHTDTGFVFVACDHLLSATAPCPTRWRLTYENLAEANHRITMAVSTRLLTGTVEPDLGPLEITRVVGWGSRWAAAC